MLKSKLISQFQSALRFFPIAPFLKNFEKFVGHGATLGSMFLFVGSNKIHWFGTYILSICRVLWISMRRRFYFGLMRLFVGFFLWPAVGVLHIPAAFIPAKQIVLTFSFNYLADFCFLTGGGGAFISFLTTLLELGDSISRL